MVSIPGEEDSDTKQIQGSELSSKKKKYSQQVPLKSQRHRSLRVHDRVACLRDIHVEDGLAVHLSGGGLGAQRRDQPGF